ncbi:MAG: hypothetical protein NTY77_04240 [Elusimicrobia bacterium]|nr:hypothetical protein [Elusimicrobiota bacterium]
METLIAVCLAVITLELSILIVVLIATLLQVKKAAQAVEVLTYRVDQQVESFGEAVRSGWMHLFGTVLNLASRYLGKSS